jgi:HEAT repeat protein
LFQELQEPSSTNEATAKLAKLGREKRKAREYLAVHLPPLIESLPALAARTAPGTVQADVAGNVVQLAVDLKLKEAVPALVKVLPKDEPGGAISMGSTERLENDPLAKALAKIGDASVIPVSHLLEDPDRDTRWRAALILLNIGSPAARRALRSHIPKEQDPNLRERLIHDVGQNNAS